MFYGHANKAQVLLLLLLLLYIVYTRQNLDLAKGGPQVVSVGVIKCPQVVSVGVIKFPVR